MVVTKALLDPRVFMFWTMNLK